MSLSSSWPEPSLFSHEALATGLRDRVMRAFMRTGETVPFTIGHRLRHVSSDAGQDRFFLSFSLRDTEVEGGYRPIRSFCFHIYESGLVKLRFAPPVMPGMGKRDFEIPPSDETEQAITRCLYHLDDGFRENSAYMPYRSCLQHYGNALSRARFKEMYVRLEGAFDMNILEQEAGASASHSPKMEVAHAFRYR